MSRVLKFRAFFNGQMSSPFHLGEGVCWPDGRVSTANKVGEVMQFTGLLDKNGKEIYEGDIIEHPAYDRPYSSRRKRFMRIGIVEWFIDRGTTVGGHSVNEIRLRAIDVKPNEKNYWCCDWSEFFQCQVIGNIHEHPHLIDSK